MKGPLYENDTFLYSLAPAILRLQIKPSGSGDENACRHEPALPMISDFPLLHSVCHGMFHGMLLGPVLR